jgi:CDP-6-deoxy-D-xylo-4-hexulose-3-dehydrase
MIKLVNDTIDATSIANLSDWLRTNPRLTKGSLTVELEKKWSTKIGTKYTVYVNSGSSAILLTLASLLFSDRLKNNKIVVPNLSWATDVSSPIILGMETLLVDCNMTDLSVDLDKLEDIFKKENPSCMILVSVLGLIPRMSEIVELCKQYDVILLEDVCESMGSKIGDRYLGTYGLASFYSLYYGHHLSTIEGGFICTDDDDLYNTMIAMRSHGWDRDLSDDVRSSWRKKHNFDDFSSLYKFYFPGFNVRSTDLQAFIGLEQIDKLDDYCAVRNANFHTYVSEVKNTELHVKQEAGEFVSNFAFPVVSKDRDAIVRRLQENDIEVRPLIAGAMSSNPFVERYCRFNEDDLSNSIKINALGFYVPNHQNLQESDIRTICNIINQ